MGDENSKRFRVVRDLEIRSAPSGNKGDNFGWLKPGYVITSEEIVSGDALEGNSKWLKDANGFYYWMGGLRSLELMTEATILTTDTESAAPAWIMQLKLPEIWHQYTGKGIGVAVVDTGICLNNPELPFMPERFLFEGGSSMVDLIGHGIHCAGIIGGRNKKQIVGAAPACNLFGVKISDINLLMRDQYGRYADALEWCLEQDGIDIISISWGSFISSADLLAKLQQIVDALVEKGKLVVAAIGNASAFPDSSKRYPAALRNVIGVGCIPVEPSLFPYLNDAVDVSADGFHIPSFDQFNQIVHKSGTSQSCAIVAGLLALYMQKSGGALTFLQAMSFLQSIVEKKRFTIEGHSIGLDVICGEKLLQIFNP